MSNTHLLSPEEQAELQAAIAEAEADVDDDAPEVKAAEPAKAPEPKAEPVAEAQPAKQPDPAKAEPDDAPLPQLEEEKDETPTQRTQHIVADADISKANAEIEAIQKYRADLHKKFKEGEIETEDYQANLDEANDRMAELKAEIKVAQTAEQTNLANTRQLWVDTVDDYRGQYAELQKPSVNAAWDFHIKQLKNDAKVQEMLANGTAASKVFRYVLKEAHKVVRTELGLGSKPAEVRDTAPPPKSLAGLPQATPAKADADEFADIDAMTGDEAEKAVMRLSPEKRERYLMRT